MSMSESIIPVPWSRPNCAFSLNCMKTTILTAIQAITTTIGTGRSCLCSYFTADGTTYDFESYFGNSRFSSVESQWDILYNSYKNLWK